MERTKIETRHLQQIIRIDSGIRVMRDIVHRVEAERGPGAREGRRI